MARFTEHDKTHLSMLKRFLATTTSLIEKVNLQNRIDELEKEMQETVIKTNTTQYLEDKKRLQTFIYILIRDYLPSGVVHEILEKHTSKCDLDSTFCNPYLELETQVLSEAILTQSTFKKVMNL